MNVSHAAQSDREGQIDSAYAVTAIVGLIAHAADSVNCADVQAEAAKRLARDIRRAAELVDEMVVASSNTSRRHGVFS